MRLHLNIRTRTYVQVYDLGLWESMKGEQLVEPTAALVRHRQIHTQQP